MKLYWNIFLKNRSSSLFIVVGVVVVVAVATITIYLPLFFVQSSTNDNNNNNNNNNNNGISNKNRNLFDNRIIGGTPARENEFPSIVWADPGCSGSLIYPNLVLSVAHCYEVFDSTGEVYIGGRKRFHGQKINIDTMFVHPKYIENDDDITNTKYDIMIVKLECSSKKQVQVLNFNNTIPMNGSRVVTAGFGEIYEDGPYSKQLLKVTVNVVPIAICQKQYNGIYSIFKASHICGGTIEGGKDSCIGDSGGPLLYRHPVTKNRTQVGLVAFGEGCGNPKYPGVYTRISTYETFITDIIKEHGDVVPNYCT